MLLERYHRWCPRRHAFCFSFRRHTLSFIKMIYRRHCPCWAFSPLRYAVFMMSMLRYYYASRRHMMMRHTAFSSLSVYIYIYEQRRAPKMIWAEMRHTRYDIMRRRHADIYDIGLPVTRYFFTYAIFFIAARFLPSPEPPFLFFCAIMILPWAARFPLKTMPPHPLLFSALHYLSAWGAAFKRVFFSSFFLLAIIEEDCRFSSRRYFHKRDDRYIHSRRYDMMFASAWWRISSSRCRFSPACHTR